MARFIHRPLYIVCLYFLLLSSACSRTVRVAIVQDEGSWFSAESFLEENPLPKGHSIGVSRGLPAVRFSSVMHADSGGPMPGAVASRWMGVKVPFFDGPLGVRSEDARSMPLLPLEEIAMPFRAATVDGFLPGEAGYPFVESIVITLEGQAQKALRAWLSALASPEGRPLVLGAIGDIVVHKNDQARLEKAGGDPALLFTDTLPLLRSRDILIANLEGPVSVGGRPNPVKKYQFRHSPLVLKAIVAAGIDHVTFANNHTLDFGPEAFLDTLRFLEAEGLTMTGAGADLAGAARAIVKKSNGESVSFLSFASYPVESRGYSPSSAAAGTSAPGILVDPDLLRKRIGEESAAGNSVVVIVHAGFEYVTTPHASIKTLYRSFVDAGASLVLGGHPHVIQGIEPWGSGMIAYSLGNFLFVGLDERELAQKSGIFSFVVFKGAVRGYSFVPAVAGNSSTGLEPNRVEAERYFLDLCDQLESAR